MKSVKPGRAPSLVSALVSFLMVIIGVAFAVEAFSVSIFTGIFALVWTGIAVTQMVYHLINALRKKRYSAFDITEEGEEPDPLNERFGAAGRQAEKHEQEPAPASPKKAACFCPWCGTSLQKDFLFCPACGKSLRQTMPDNDGSDKKE